MKKLLFSIFLIMMMIGGTASYAVNAPVLADGMTPVKWDSSSGDWVETNTTDADWYNYEQVPSTSSTIAGNGTGKWANAVTADGSMWVWIPRYTYKIVSGNHRSGNSFSNDTAGTNEIAIKWSNGTTDDNSSSYLSHPAFTLNGEELTGFWVAKVEATESSSFQLGKNILVAIWPTAYDKVKSIQNGHLIRNSEWGAVAYLTNAIGRIPFGELDNGVAGELNGYDWNTVAGVKGSTTHNIYGVYGMNGGANEWVAGAVSASGNIPNVEFYTSAYDSSNKGDAVYETSDESGNTWDGGTYTVPGSNLAFTRGADSIFSFNGCKMDREMGYRAVISISTTPATYTVTFNSNTGSGTIIQTTTQIFTAGVAQRLASNTFSKAGYKFSKWSTSSAGIGTSYADEASYTATADITLYARWTLVDYTITYNLDGGTVSGTNPTTYTITSSAITLKNPTKEGYTFKGWTGSNGTTPQTTVTIPKGSTGNKSYTANWEANTYTVSYDANGGTNAPANQTKTYGVDLTLTTDIPTYEGYIFKGWNTVANGSGNSYASGATYSANENLTLYAQWEEEISSYNLIVNNGIASSEGPVSSGETITITAAPNTGYRFVNWTVNGITLTDAQKTSATISFVMPENDVTVTANFELMTYTITFNSNYKNGATAITKTQTFTHGVAKNLDDNTFSMTGYTFKEWNTNVDGTGTSYANGASYTATSDTVLYAQWTPITYTISYELNGGTVSGTNPTSYTVESSAITLINPTKEGYTFAGWTGTGLSSATKTVTIPTGSTGNRTYTANWTANTYTVSYDANGGTNAPASQTKTHGVDLTLTSDIPTYTGYTFAGWTTNQDGTGDNYAAGAVYTANASVTLYAKWVAGSGTGYTVYHYFENANDTNYTLYKTENKTGTTGATITLSNEKIAIVGGTYKQGSLTEGGAVATTTTISADGTTKIYLYYSRNTYTLTLNKNSYVDSVSGAGTYKYEASVSIDATLGSAEGYTYSFTNWTSSNTSLVPNQATKSATITMPAGDVTLTANASRTPITYTISYELDGGAVSGTNPASYTVESESITLINPVKSGYTFVGWTGTGLSSATKTVTIPTGSTGNKSYTANWDLIQYTLTVNDGTASASRMATPGEAITATAVVPEGKVFKEWVAVGITLSDAEKTSTTLNFTMPSNDVTLTATLEGVSYTVSYDANGGNNAPASQTKTHGVDLTLTSDIPTRTGYTFEKWTTNEDGTGDSYLAGTTYTANASVNLYAKWTPITYTISYNLDGGAVSGTNPTSYTIESEDITLINPTKTGFAFTGWTGSNGVTPEMTVVIPNGSTGDKGYIANWAVSTFTISFNANDGKTQKEILQHYNSGEPTKLRANTFTRTGYTFVEWNTEADGTGTSYADEATITITYDMTLYAQWTPQTGTGYTVYHYFENLTDTDYTLYKTENKTGTTEATITLANEKIAIVGGTYKQGSLTEGGAVATTTTIAADGTTKIYLYYSRNTYTLTLNKNSYVDSVSGAGTYKYGASVSIDATLGSATGYEYSFTNWTSSNTSLVPNQATKSATITMPAGDVTLTANASRTAMTYTISYELDGGAVSGTNPTSYTVESSTITLVNPIKSGYTFAGWTGSNGTTPSITVTIPTGSIGNRFYTANWTVTEYTLTINNGTTTTSENVIPGTTKTATAVIPSGKHFNGWTAVGITLTDAQKTATTISFEMPSNDVTLIAVLDDNIRVIWAWDTTDDLTKTISLKTTGQSTIDWGDGQVSNIISSTSKFTLSHTYATAGNYNVVMDGDKVTYLDISDKKVTAFTTEGAVALNELFIYNNEFTTLALGTVNKVVTDSNVQTTGTVSKLLRVGVNGTGNFTVSDDLRITFTTTSIHELKSITLNGSNVTVQNPYNASALTGTNTVIATFDVKSDIGELNGEITWNWAITSSLTRTVTATVSSDTVILWGDGNYDVVLAGSARTISHTYASTGNYTAGFLDSAVTSISIPNSNVTSINVAKGTTLEKLNVSRNVLSYIDLKTNKALKEFYASYNNFTTVDLTNNTSLEKVELAGNKISVMNLATSAPITLLDVGGNRLSSLDVSNFALLETLRCYDNGISTLNLGTIANLKVLDISNNALTGVNVSYNTKLEELYCNYNELTSLDVSKNTLLKVLKCENNKITSLNVTNAAELTEIRTFNNAITTLNLLNNSKLDLAIVDLDCTVSLNDATENILRLKAKEHGYIDAYDYVTGRFIPETGYRVESVKLNDIEQGSITSLTLSSCIGDNTLIATFVLDDSQGTQVVINMPNILDGMIPVKWNGTAWVITVQGDSEWYDYSSSNMKWANVMLRDGAKYMEGDVSTDVSDKALSELNGKIVDSNNMGSMFVWIPRFSYLVEGSNISVKFSNGLVDDTSDGYILHPAFNFSSYNGGDTSSSLNYEPQLSESDKLLGFWVAKYPASNNNGKVASKDATEWTNISINNAFVNSKNMFGSNLSSYGISVNSDVTIYDSHLMKNVEWGATAYLATALGNIGTSTTGNETGVYGMNSGKEFVASYIELVGGISNYSVRANGVNLLTYAIDGYTPDAEVSRYIDKVKLVSPDDTQANNRARLDDYYGTATTETNGSASVPYKVNAFFVRGENGIFDYSGSDGSASSTISFRPTIFAEVLSSSITTHQITSTTNAYGRISPLGTVTVMDGGSQKYLLTPNDGAEIVDVLVDGISVLSELTEVTATTKAYIFTNVTSNHTINVIFDLPVAPYTVTATVQPENAGTVEGVGTHNSRSTVTLTTVPNAGYVFESWTVIGNSVTLGNLTSATISFTMPSNNVSLQANFKEGQYALLKVEMSDVSFESMEAVGKTIEVSAVTETGYVFSKWEATGITLTEEQKVSANITFVMPANAVTLIASYTEQTVASQYTIEVIQTANGTITPGTTLVNSGANQTFNIAPNTGYVLSELKIDGNAVTTASSYTFENVTSNHTTTATFSPIRYTITTISDEGAEITGVYTNHVCSECGGYDHECDVVNIFIEANNAEITEE